MTPSRKSREEHAVLVCQTERYLESLKRKRRSTLLHVQKPDTGTALDLDSLRKAERSIVMSMTSFRSSCRLLEAPFVRAGTSTALMQTCAPTFVMGSASCRSRSSTTCCSCNTSCNKSGPRLGKALTLRHRSRDTPIAALRMCCVTHHSGHGSNVSTNWSTSTTLSMATSGHRWRQTGLPLKVLSMIYKVQKSNSRAGQSRFWLWHIYEEVFDEHCSCTLQEMEFFSRDHVNRVIGRLAAMQSEHKIEHQQLLNETANARSHQQKSSSRRKDFRQKAAPACRNAHDKRQPRNRYPSEPQRSYRSTR